MTNQGGGVVGQGSQFGRWTVVERVARKMGLEWRCRCVCGAERIHHQRNLVMAKTRSCGCWAAELISKAKKQTHCMSRTPSYRLWRSMLQRCRDPKSKDFPHYGGRGIRVCDRWKTFENFLADMGVRPAGLSLDRVDNGKNYEPGNCRWATVKEQQRNMRSNRLITYRGETRCLAEWAEIAGLTWATLAGRLNKGWSVDRALAIGPLVRIEASRISA